MQITREKPKLEFPFHVAKRMDTSKKTIWVIRSFGFIIALLLSAVFTTILKPGSFGTFFANIFAGIFDPSDPEMLTSFLEYAAILLLLALALLPSFKMKFWNIGAEGQAMIACLMTALITTYMPSDMNSALVLLLALAASLLASIIWAVLPAIFKAFFNTNETLFTLMMNYIAIGLCSLTVAACFRTSSGTWGSIYTHQLPDLFGIKYILTIIIVIVVAVLMYFYLRKTKHGYEISVVGESHNTAKYVGINVKKVIIRTLVLSGALCGLAGFLIVAGNKHTLNNNLLAGRGFTAVLIAWLGHFDSIEIIVYSLLVAFFSRGAFNAASHIGIDTTYFSGIITGVFFLIVIATEFITNYRVLRKYYIADPTLRAIERAKRQDRKYTKALIKKYENTNPEFANNLQKHLDDLSNGRMVK